MTVEYNHKDYTLIWSDGDIQDGIGGWVIVDKYNNPLVRATTNGVPPTEEQAKAIIEATLKGIGKYLDMVLLYGKVERKPLKGYIFDLKMESE